MTTKRVRILLGDDWIMTDVIPVDDCFAVFITQDLDLYGDFFTLVHTPTGLIAGQAGSKSKLERFVAMLRTTDIDWSISDIGHYHSADVLEKSRAVRQRWLGAQ